MGNNCAVDERSKCRSYVFPAMQCFPNCDIVFLTVKPNNRMLEEMASFFGPQTQPPCLERGRGKLSLKYEYSMRLKDIPSQNDLLLRVVATHGSRWKEIQETHFPTRSANNLKNQYVYSHREGIRKNLA